MSLLKTWKVTVACSIEICDIYICVCVIVCMYVFCPLTFSDLLPVKKVERKFEIAARPLCLCASFDLF